MYVSAITPNRLKHATNRDASPLALAASRTKFIRLSRFGGVVHREALFRNGLLLGRTPGTNTREARHLKRDWWFGGLHLLAQSYDSKHIMTHCFGGPSIYGTARECHSLIGGRRDTTGHLRHLRIVSLATYKLVSILTGGFKFVPPPGTAGGGEGDQDKDDRELELAYISS